MTHIQGTGVDRPDLFQPLKVNSTEKANSVTHSVAMKYLKFLVPLGCTSFLGIITYSSTKKITPTLVSVGFGTVISGLALLAFNSYSSRKIRNTVLNAQTRNYLKMEQFDEFMTNHLSDQSIETYEAWIDDKTRSLIREKYLFFIKNPLSPKNFNRYSDVRDAKFLFNDAERADLNKIGEMWKNVVKILGEDGFSLHYRRELAKLGIKGILQSESLPAYAWLFTIYVCEDSTRGIIKFKSEEQFREELELFKPYIGDSLYEYFAERDAHDPASFDKFRNKNGSEGFKYLKNKTIKNKLLLELVKSLKTYTELGEYLDFDQIVPINDPLIIEPLKKLFLKLPIEQILSPLYVKQRTKFHLKRSELQGKLYDVWCGKPLLAIWEQHHDLFLASFECMEPAPEDSSGIAKPEIQSFPPGDWTGKAKAEIQFLPLSEILEKYDFLIQYEIINNDDYSEKVKNESKVLSLEIMFGRYSKLFVKGTLDADDIYDKVEALDPESLFQLIDKHYEIIMEVKVAEHKELINSNLPSVKRRVTQHILNKLKNFINSDLDVSNTLVKIKDNQFISKEVEKYLHEAKEEHDRAKEDYKQNVNVFRRTNEKEIDHERLKREAEQHFANIESEKLAGSLVEINEKISQYQSEAKPFQEKLAQVTHSQSSEAIKLVRLAGGIASKIRAIDELKRLISELENTRKSQQTKVEEAERKFQEEHDRLQQKILEDEKELQDLESHKVVTPVKKDGMEAKDDGKKDSPRSKAVSVLDKALHHTHLRKSPDVLRTQIEKLRDEQIALQEVKNSFRLKITEQKKALERQDGILQTKQLELSIAEGDLNSDRSSHDYTLTNGTALDRQKQKLEEDIAAINGRESLQTDRMKKTIASFKKAQEILREKQQIFNEFDSWTKVKREELDAKIRSAHTQLDAKLEEIEQTAYREIKSFLENIRD
jgi:hypothetical protein